MPIMTCPACGGAIPDGARFCPSCGRPVSVAGGEERKLATIVFADLTDSSQLATRMDAEALRALLADVYDQLSQVVASFGGTVEKFIGDAIMAVFGVPTAHEDDPERAVRAALGMRSRLTGIARRHGQDLILRVGVNTGVVATGSDIGRDFLEKGIENIPDDYYLYQKLGELYRQKYEDHCKAAEAYKKAAEFEKSPDYVKRFYGYELAQCPGHEKEAYEYLRKRYEMGDKERLPSLINYLKKLENDLDVPEAERIKSE